MESLLIDLSDNHYSKMKFTICVTKPEYWNEIHDLLCHESSCANIPDRAIDCVDEKLHSPTRGTFDLTVEEADELRNHEKIKWVELCPTCNPDAYPIPQLNTDRFKKEVKIYRENVQFSGDGFSITYS